MKKWIVLILTSLLTLPMVAKTEDSETARYLGSNDVLVSGEQVQINKDASVIPLFQDSTVFVPVRFITETLDMEVLPGIATLFVSTVICACPIKKLTFFR